MIVTEAENDAVTAGAAEHWDICLSTLRDIDRDRYLACLLSPADKRGALASLYAFHAEIARIRDVIHQPLAGEIRLQWWRDLLSGTAEGESNANPIAAGLLATIEAYRLPREVLVNMTEARIFDLYDDPMPDRNALEGYAGETAAALIQLAGLVLDAPAAMQRSESAGHAGVAQAIAGILLLLPLHRKRGQVYLPLDIGHRPRPGQFSGGARRRAASCGGGSFCGSRSRSSVEGEAGRRHPRLALAGLPARLAGGAGSERRGTLPRRRPERFFAAAPVASAVANAADPCRQASLGPFLRSHIRASLTR